MSDLSNTIDNLKTRLNENINVIGGQKDRLNSWLNDFNNLVGSLLRMEEENKKLAEENKKLVEQNKKLQSDLASAKK